MSRKLVKHITKQYIAVIDYGMLDAKETLAPS